ITAGAATQLSFSVQPSNTGAGAAITPATQATALDGQGNTATGFTGNVTVALGANPGSGTLSGTTTVAPVAGVATFPGLSINKARSEERREVNATGQRHKAGPKTSMFPEQIKHICLKCDEQD